MAALDGMTHLAAALRWSADREVMVVELLAAGVAMAAPVAIGAALGQLDLGLAAALGAMVVADVCAGPTIRAHLRRLVTALVPAALAAIAATVIAGHGWISDALVVVLATAAATIGGAWRSLAIAGLRFVLFLVLISAAAESAGHPASLLAVILVGALLGAVVSLMLGALPGLHRRAAIAGPAPDPASSTSTAHKLARWKRTLAQLAGWQYPLRLAGCLAAATLVRWAWPDHHAHWVALVVTILTQRQPEPLPIKPTQRGLGTVLGVALASLFVAFQPPVWALIAGIAVLAGLRPLLKARNYFAYSAIMTPLVVLIMGAGRPLGPGILFDRLIATLIGAALVMIANQLCVRWLAGSQPRPG